jgi:folate-binding protein YgfZ
MGLGRFYEVLGFMIYRLIVEGKDSRDFLNRVTASRVKALKPQEGARGFLCAGNSRMIGQFDLLCRGENQFLLAAPEECFSEVCAELERLHFSESLEMKKEGVGFGLSSFEPKADERSVSAAVFSWNPSEDRWPTPVAGYSFVANGSSITESFSFARIGAGYPWPKLDWKSENTALESGMLPWVDRDKGCYPGQEVIELSLNVGHPARSLTAWEGSESIECGALSLPGGQKAEVLSVVKQGQRTRLFLRSPWKLRDEPPKAGFVKIFRAE